MLLARSTKFRRGLTLVELMVTLAIAVVLMAIALPTIKFTLESSKIREASRQVNTFFAGAKVRAASTGRPWGVWLERDVNNFNVCTKLFLAEVPQYYAGDFIDQSRLSVVSDSTDLSTYCGAGAVARWRLTTPGMMGGAAQGNNQGLSLLIDDANDMSALAAVKKLNCRFQIRFDYKGPWYPGIRVGTEYYLYSEAANTETYDLMFNRAAAPPTNTNGLPYQIMRAPRRSDSTVLELPRGTAIDLAYSGGGGSGVEMRGTNACQMMNGMTLIGLYPIVIMVQPSGAASKVHINGIPSDVVAPIHLLVGRVERVQPWANDTLTMDTPYQFGTVQTKDLRDTYNLYDPESLWVSLGHRAGSLTTTENNILNPANGATVIALPPASPDCFSIARQIALTHQAKGGL